MYAYKLVSEEDLATLIVEFIYDEDKAVRKMDLGPLSWILVFDDQHNQI